MGRINTHSLVVVFLRAAAIAGIALKASRHVPRTLKWLFLFIITLNLRGFPLAWHVRHLSPWINAALKDGLTAKIKGRKVWLERLTNISPIGAHPLDVVEILKLRAGVADCDYNGHLSNSSYAKNLDFVRLNAAVRFFGGFSGHGVGGHVALAGTYHLFIKEIPLHTDYEIWLYFGGWEEQKWVYLTAAFIARKKGKQHDKAGDVQGVRDAATQQNEGASESTSASLVMVPPRAEGDNGTSGSSEITTPSALPTSTPSEETTNETQAALEAMRIRLPPDVTLHAVAVSQYCFKLGRVTVPPRVAFIASGFGDPERWERLMTIRRQPGGAKEIRKLMQGGWKDRETWGEFWDFKDCEPRGRQGGDQLKKLRFIMGAVAGDG